MEIEVDGGHAQRRRKSERVRLLQSRSVEKLHHSIWGQKRLCAPVGAGVRVGPVPEEEGSDLY